MRNYRVMSQHIRRWLWLAALLSGLSGRARAATDEALNPAVISWLEAQTNIQTWAADFTQTRKLKSLVKPLTASGHVWFQAPNRFRWELQQPAQTIALRAPRELLIIYPRLKRLERFPLDQSGPWRDALSLLEAGFPRSQEALQKQYNILSQTFTSDSGSVALQPKSAMARRMIPRLEIEFDLKTHALRRTELLFADGSSMRNDFTNESLNPPVEPQLFSPQVPEDYKIVEPFKTK